jgi:predicted nucleic acid-binding protein
VVKPAVLDASALIALLFDEPGAQAVEDLFSRRPAASRPVLITAVNWAEAIYRTQRKQPREGGEILRRFVDATPLQIVAADRRLAEAAARLKQGYGLALCDAFAAALAQVRAAQLYTAARDFAPLAHVLAIRWLR